MQIDGGGEGDGLRRHDVAREGIAVKVPRWAPASRSPRRKTPRRVAPKSAPAQPVESAAAEPRPRPEKPLRPRRRLTMAEIQVRVRAKFGRDLPPKTLSLRLRLAGWAYDPATDMWAQDEGL